jgi:hypothetical protein
MGPKEIVRMIEKEIDGNWAISNLHGCDLKECLVRPKRRKLNLFDGSARDGYIVLEEYPETHEGYTIFFDEVSGCFGLAQSMGSRNYVLGFHDSFLAAFKAM